MILLIGVVLLVPAAVVLAMEQQWVAFGCTVLAAAAVVAEVVRQRSAGPVAATSRTPAPISQPRRQPQFERQPQQRQPPEQSEPASPVQPEPQPAPSAQQTAQAADLMNEEISFEDVAALAAADPSLLRAPSPSGARASGGLPTRQVPAGDETSVNDAFLAQARKVLVGEEGDPAILVIELDGMRDIQTVLGDDQTPTVVAAATSRVRDVATDWPVGSLADDRLVVAMMTRPFLPAHHLARSIRDSLARPMAIDGIEFRLASSVGIAQGPEDPEVLMRRATVAAQNASRQNSGVERHTTTNPTEVRRRLLVAAALSDALEAPAARNFGVAFQPIVTPRGELAKAEALARWEDPKVGPVSPSEFVPLAERTGLIDPMLDIVMRSAMDGCIRWRAAGIDAGVSVNLSPINLRKPLLVSELTAAIDASTLDPTHVTLEITETAVIDDGLNAIRILRDLRAAGFTIAIDDFGVGESSLSRLQDLPVSIVKLDGSFSKKLTTDRRSSAIIRATVEVCRALDMTVIAEGIETGEQADVAAEIGVHLLQGFLFATALTVEDIIGDGGQPQRRQQT